jgi:hypothetical protein
MDNEQLLNEIGKLMDTKLAILRDDLDEGQVMNRELAHLDVADRHESLAQTVEIMAMEGRRLQRSVADLLRITTGLVELSRRHDKRIEKLEGDAA